MRHSGFQEIFRCESCKHIQKAYNLSICLECGNKPLMSQVGRWIRTKNLWDWICYGYSGYWELKEELEEKRASISSDDYEEII